MPPFVFIPSCLPRCPPATLCFAVTTLTRCWGEVPLLAMKSKLGQLGGSVCCHNRPPTNFALGATDFLVMVVQISSACQSAWMDVDKEQEEVTT